MIEAVKHIFIAIILGLLQSYLIQEVPMGFYLKPMPYLMLFFVLPLDLNRFVVLISAFIYGTLIDLSSGSFGTHTAATVIMVFIKYYVDKALIDFDSLKLQGESYIGLESKGWMFFVYYSLSLIFIHHFLFFGLDFFEISSIIRILTTTLVSTMGTFSLVLLFKSLFKK